MTNAQQQQQQPTQGFPTLYACTVYGGGKITAMNATCMENLRTACASAGLNCIVSRNGGTGTDRSRNREVARFLESGADAMIQIDDDIGFDPMDVIRMFRTGLPVIGAAYPCKEIEWARVASAVKAGVKDEELPYFACRPIFNQTLGLGRVYPELDNFTVAEVGELPTGFLMVRRDALVRFIDFWRDDIEYVTDYPPHNAIHHMVFSCQRDPRCARETSARHLLAAAKKGDQEALVRAAGEYRATIGDPSSLGRYVTEDYANTVMWRLMGEKANLAVDVKLTHMGVHAYVGDVRRQLGISSQPLDANATTPATAQASPSRDTASPAPDPSLAFTCAACGTRDPSSATDAASFRCGQCGHRESALARGAILGRVKSAAPALQLKVCPPEHMGVQSVLAGSYDVPGLSFDTPPTVLDIGANIGAFTVWARHRWPGAKVVAYEPSPSNMALLRYNAGIPESDAHEVAVIGNQWPEDTKALPLYGGAHNPGEQSLYQLGEQRPGGVMVNVARARELPPCDVMKLDTEGCEREILESYPHLAGVTAIMLEWHRKEDYDHLKAWLPTLGFRLVQDDTGGAWARDRNLIFVRPAPQLHTNGLSPSQREASPPS